MIPASRLALVMASILVAASAVAGPKPPAPATPAAEAKKAAKEGTARFKTGRYQEALGFFLISYAKQKEPVVAWNIARCYEELGEPPQALRYFEEYRAVAPDAAGRAKADAKIEAMKARIAAAAAPPPVPVPAPVASAPLHAAVPSIGIDERARAVVKVLAMGLPRFARAGKGGVVPVAVPDAGYGSGIVVSDDCVVLTNRHVVDDKIAIAVRFEGTDRVFPATVAHAAPDADVAVLLVDRAVCRDVMPVDGERRAPERGRTVFRVGYGGEVPGAEAHTRVASVKRGIVSRVAEVRGEKLIEIDAPVNPGDSGGLLATEAGEFAGMTVAKVEGVEGVGFAIPPERVTAALRAAEADGALAKARALLAGKEWASRRLLGEVCADLVETSPDDMHKAILATEEKRVRTTKAFEGAKGIEGEVLLLTAAAAWNVGTWMVLEGGPARNKDGWKLLDGCRDAARAAPKGNPALASNDFVKNVDEAYRSLKRGKDPVVMGKPAQARPRDDGSPWEMRIGKSFDVYFHWLVWFYEQGDEHERTLLNFATGFQLPIVGKGRFEAGLGVGYGFTYFDARAIEDNLHRIMFPLRARYWFLIADVGPQMVYHTTIDRSGDEKGKLEAGALVRFGFSIGGEVGFEYDYVPVQNDYVDFYGLYLGFGF